MDNYQEALLYDFSKQDEIPEWMIINDGVMGGVSSSNLSFHPEGYLVFEGNISLENNGGFASFRTQSAGFDLSDYRGVKIRVRGDGKKYSFRLYTNNAFDGVAYVADFRTIKSEWQEIRIPFTDFTPRFRGRIILNTEAIDTRNIRQLGFMISEKQQGSFTLEIKWITAWKD